MTSTLVLFERELESFKRACDTLKIKFLGIKQKSNNIIYVDVEYDYPCELYSLGQNQKTHEEIIKLEKNKEQCITTK